MDRATPEAVGFSAARLARIDRRMQRYVDEQKFAGIVTLLARCGKIVQHGAYGQRELAINSPMALETLFRIYSMTKPITSVAAMMLYEEGYFHLADPVNKFLPEFAACKVLTRQGPDGLEYAPLARPITIRDLITHTSGLSYGFFVDSPAELMYQAIHNAGDYLNAPTLYPTDLSMAELVSRWATVPLIFQPGERWRYSIGTDVIGRLVEVITGQSLAQFFSEQIFQPLGMVDTGFTVPAAKVARFAAMYTHTADGALDVLDPAVGGPFTRNHPMHAGGAGLVSTAADYLRFCQMLLNGGVLDGVQLLGRKTVELITANHLSPSQLPMRHGNEIFAGEGFGLGFGVIINAAASGMPWSNGTYYWGGAANTTFWIDPHEELIGILMAQYMPAGTYPVNEDFRVLAYQALVG